MKILHIITGLNRGGAEFALIKFLADSRKQQLDSLVISLTGRGDLAEQVEALGYKVIALDKTYLFPLTITKLYQIVKKYKPDIVQTWMYHADLLGGIAAKLCGVKQIYWGIHCSYINTNFVKIPTKIVAKLSAWLSGRIPSRIISCSRRGTAEHIKYGYRSSKFVYIPNGFDVERFQFNALKRQKLRCEWQIAEQQIVVGTAIKFAPEKGYDVLMKAIKIILKQDSSILFALVGRGLTTANEVLMQEINILGISGNILLLGEIEDMPGFYSAIDIFVLPSLTEGFPTVLGEAMACARPCVSTDVGAAKKLIENVGIIVPIANPSELSEALLHMKNLTRKELLLKGNISKLRVTERFSHEKIFNMYMKIYQLKNHG